MKSIEEVLEYPHTKELGSLEGGGIFSLRTASELSDAEIEHPEDLEHTGDRLTVYQVVMFPFEGWDTVVIYSRSGDVPQAIVRLISNMVFYYDETPVTFPNWKRPVIRWGGYEAVLCNVLGMGDPPLPELAKKVRIITSTLRSHGDKND